MLVAAFEAGVVAVVGIGEFVLVLGSVGEAGVIASEESYAFGWSASSAEVPDVVEIGGDDEIEADGLAIESGLGGGVGEIVLGVDLSCAAWEVDAPLGGDGDGARIWWSADVPAPGSGGVDLEAVGEFVGGGEMDEDALREGASADVPGAHEEDADGSGLAHQA